MTGYATAQGTTEDGVAFTVSLKSVNHRFLDLNLRLPGDCDALEVALRRLIKERVKRGHLDVTLHVERRAREQTQTVQLNRELLAAHVQIFHEAAKLHHFNVEPNLNELLLMPGVLSAEAPAAAPDPARGPALEAAVMALAPGLIEQLNQVRGVEGAALAGELRAAMIRAKGIGGRGAALRTGAREAHFERLRHADWRVAEGGCGDGGTGGGAGLRLPHAGGGGAAGGAVGHRGRAGAAARAHRELRRDARWLVVSWASGWIFYCRN